MVVEAKSERDKECGQDDVAKTQQGEGGGVREYVFWPDNLDSIGGRYESQSSEDTEAGSRFKKNGEGRSDRTDGASKFLATLTMTDSVTPKGLTKTKKMS